MISSGHLPVLVDEVVTYLRPNANKVWVDGTVGAGGHAAKLIEAVAEAEAVAWIIGVDRDPEMLKLARQKLHDFLISGHRMDLVHDSYANLPRILAQVGVKPAVVDVVLLDLGFNSLQLAQTGRGFSFHDEGPSDMRFDRSSAKPTAVELIRQTSEKDLEKILRDFGEETFARRVARALKIAVESDTIQSSRELAQVVRQAIPRKAQSRKIDAATKTFQALRIAVNGELDELTTFLEGFPQWLSKGCRIGIITFHSLEDRLVKMAFNRYAKPCTCPPGFPLCVCKQKPQVRLLTKKPIVASAREIETNPRARSAKLRLVELI